jgi:hypothetical protein
MANHGIGHGKPGPLFEEYIQTLRGVKNHKMRKHIIFDVSPGKATAPGQLKKAEREYHFENVKGEKFVIKFHEGKKGGKNPDARMRIEVHDPDLEQQPDPARKQNDPVMTVSIEHVSEWTATEVMLFVRENILMPEQEIYVKFFGPQSVIRTATHAALNAIRNFRIKSRIYSESRSELKKDFFTA